MNDFLLAAALEHHEAGRRVLPVKANKKPHCNRWGQWIEKPPKEQTEQDIYRLFSNGAAGIAIIQYPGSPNVTVDFDGVHADLAWNKTGITLTPTAKTRTPRNGWHWIYRTPDDTSLLDRVKRRVRLAVAGCDCKDAEGNSHPCGVDLLINGYSIEPPTPGYREDPEHPLESAAEIQLEVLELALHQQEEEKTGARPTGDADGKVRRGHQHDTAISLVGTMRRRGMAPQAIRAALKADYDARFEPPLTDKEIDYFVGEAAKWDPGEETFHLTELGNAQRLVKLHGEDLRFCSERGWYTWDVKRWAHDRTGEIKRHGKDTVRSIYLEAAHCTDGKMRDALGEHARRSEAKARIDAMIALAESEPGVPVSHDELDRDPWLLNVANGTIDLRTGTLRPHNRDDLITKIVSIIFDPSAECPEWLKFLDRVFAGRGDLIGFLRKAIGYSLTGLTTEQCAFLLYGLGANGKSTLLKILSDVLGDYWRQMRTESLMLKHGGDTIPNDIAALFGVRLATAVETENGRRLAESVIKQMTGGDTMTARFLHREFFDFEPQLKIWLACNHKPRITGTDLAIWRRIRLIPFTVRIPEDERDPDLLNKLRAELPGILAWAVVGCQLWQEHGLKPPEEVISATNEYRQESDSVAQFIEERCSVSAAETVSKNGLYESYQKWSEESGERPLTKKALGMRLLEKGFKEIRNEKSRFWVGLGLLP